MSEVALLRVYALPDTLPVNSFLIDRLWPRGISKERLEGAVWLKQVAPSDALRRWFHQNTDEWSEFCHRYEQELLHSNEWKPLAQLLKEKKTLTLLYGAKDTEHNHAVVLKNFLLKYIKA